MSEDLASWMSGFKNELDEPSFEMIFTRLKDNHFKTRTHLKLLSPKEIDIMFTAGELPLGAKAMLLYQLEQLRNTLPLPLPRKRTRQNEGKLSNNIHDYDEEESAENSSHPPTVRNSPKAVLPAFEEQVNNLKGQLVKEKDEYNEIEITIQSMAENVKEKPTVGNSRVVCSNCHTRGHRNQQNKPCLLPKCIDYTCCGMKDKHPEYFSRLSCLKTDLRRKANTVKELESQIQSMEDFTSNSEYHFIKNLTPRLYKVDQSYKLNKPKLMRDIRMLRKWLDGKIPPNTVNDSEQLRILLCKCKKNFKLDIEAPTIFTDSHDQSKLAADELTVPDNQSPVKNNFKDNVQSEERSSTPMEGKRKKDKKRHRKHRRKRRRRYSSSSSSDSNPDFVKSSKGPAAIFDNSNYSSSFPPYGFRAANIIPHSGFSYIPGYLPASHLASSSIPYPMQGYFPTAHTPPLVFENTNKTYLQHCQQGLHYETALPLPSVHTTQTSSNQRISTADTTNTTVINVSSPEKWSGLDTLVEVANEIQL